MARVAFENISKVFDDETEAVVDFNLDVSDGELVVLVGPSGCGKSTLLRLLAGLEQATSGELRIGDQRVNSLPPQERDVAMVFQNYALYPHMTVRQNMAFPLRMMKRPRTEIEELVRRTAAILGMEPLMDRKPAQLSGGQRQRVAMGRALVRDPAVFLLDEPLSNLDAKLRVQMRSEISALQRRLGTTTLYVTHDQVEAMTMGHRLAVLRKGRLQQVGPPQELYEKPANLFVATFIGSPSMSVFVSRVERDASGGSKLKFGEHWLRLKTDQAVAPAGSDVIAGLRPEAFVPADSVPESQRVELEVENSELMGHEQLVYFKAGIQAPPASLFSEDQSSDKPRSVGGNDDGDRAHRSASLVARLAPAMRLSAGEKFKIGINLDRLYLFDSEGGTLAEKRKA